MDLELFDFNEKSSILFFFFLNGLIFFFLALRKGIQNQSKADKWLSFFIVLCMFYIGLFMLGYGGWYNDSNKYLKDIMFYTPFQHLFLIGPTILYYTRTFLNPKHKFQRSDFYHFIPAVLYNLYILVVFVVDKIILNEYYFYADGMDMDLDAWYQWAGLISMILYLYLSLKEYNHYHTQVYNNVSFADAITYRWIQRFLISFLFILVLRVLFFILNPEWGQFGSKFWYYLCFSVLFYYIAFNGYFSAIQRSLSLQYSYAASIPATLQETVVSIADNEKSSDFEKENAMDEKELTQWKSQLVEVMESRLLYQNPNLTLSDVAETISTHPKQISTIINQGFEMNFNDWVNHYRANAVIMKFKQGEHIQKTILAIALECGFNSKSTFNRAFKKYTGDTPKKYLDKIDEK